MGRVFSKKLVFFAKRKSQREYGGKNNDIFQTRENGFVIEFANGFYVFVNIAMLELCLRIC